MKKIFKSELGRSMVEMLGVLALVGVLSVAAIAGYSYAITKWKAGEVLSDLHVRALEYTRQMAMQKKFASDFAFENFDLGNENALGNPVAGYPLYDDPDFFEIEVRGVSAEVCRQIIRDADRPILDVAVNGGDWGALEEECGVETPADLVTMTFLFSKTLEDTGDPLEAPAVVTKPRPDDCPASRWANIAGVCCAEDERGTGGHCCPKTSTGWGQNVGRCCMAGEVYSNGNCCPSGQFWDKNTKRCVSEAVQCASNDDCLPNEFCAYSRHSSCLQPTMGVCQPVAVSRTKTVQGITFKKSSKSMNFFSAENFCARIGGEMVPLKTFGCNHNFWETSPFSGYCNATDPEAETQDTSSSGTRSSMVKELKSVGSYVWLSDAYPNNACYCYLINLSDGWLGVDGRVSPNDYYYALCRMNK